MQCKIKDKQNSNGYNEYMYVNSPFVEFNLQSTSYNILYEKKILIQLFTVFLN